MYCASDQTPRLAASGRLQLVSPWLQHVGVASLRLKRREHFREEEEILLPACAGFVDADLPIIAKVLTDHVRIRHLANTAAGPDSPSVTLVHELGGELERHVRREERELFPLIEQSMPYD